MSYPIEDYTPPYSQSKHDLRSSYAWDGLLSRSDVLAAPVKAFRHVSAFNFIKFVNLSNSLKKSCVFTRKIQRFFNLCYCLFFRLQWTIVGKISSLEWKLKLKIVILITTQASFPTPIGWPRSSEFRGTMLIWDTRASAKMGPRIFGWICVQIVFIQWVGVRPKENHWFHRNVRTLFKSDFLIEIWQTFLQQFKPNTLTGKIFWSRD